MVIIDLDNIDFDDLKYVEEAALSNSLKRKG